MGTNTNEIDELLQEMADAEKALEETAWALGEARKKLVATRRGSDVEWTLRNLAQSVEELSPNFRALLARIPTCP